MEDNKLPIFMKLSPKIKDFGSVKVGFLFILLRSIYGLKQSVQLWNQKVIAFFRTLGFTPLNADLSILIIGKAEGEILIISIYVDDFLLISNSSKVLAWLKDSIAKKYNVEELKEVKTIIRWQITRDFDTKMLKIDLSAFIHNFHKKKNMTNCNTVNIGMKARCFIDMQEREDYEKVEIKLYQWLISKLMYLSCGSRPDISFAIGQLNKHDADLQIDYMKVTKKVLCYLKGIMHLVLIYGGHLQDERETKVSIIPFQFNLIRYGDYSYAGDFQDRKLVIRYC